MMSFLVPKAGKQHYNTKTYSTNQTHFFHFSRGELLTVILPDGKPIDYVV